MKLYFVAEFDFSRNDGADLLEEDCRRFVTEAVSNWMRDRAESIVPEGEPYQLDRLGLGLQRILPYSVPSPEEVQVLADRIAAAQSDEPQEGGAGEA